GVRTQSSGHPVGLQSVPGGPLRRDPPSARRLRARDRGARGRCHAGLARPRGPYRRPPADAPAEPVPPGQRRNRDRRLHRGTGGDALGRGSRRPRRRPGEPVPRRAAARAPRRDDGADLDLRRESPALGHGAWKRGDPACAEPGRPLATGSAAAPRAGRGPGDRRLTRAGRASDRPDVRAARAARLRLAARAMALLAGAARRRAGARRARREPGGAAAMTAPMGHETTVPAGREAPGEHDVIVVGGGPAGSTTAAVLARAGRRVLLLEREPFPRFHVGESLLPATLPILDRLGAHKAIAERGFQVKYGATFHDQESGLEHTFYFLRDKPWPPYAYQVPRAEFDALLLEHAKKLGVDVRQPATALAVAFDADGVTVTAESHGQRT